MEFKASCVYTCNQDVLESQYALFQQCSPCNVKCIDSISHSVKCLIFICVLYTVNSIASEFKTITV